MILDLISAQHYDNGVWWNRERLCGSTTVQGI